MRTSVLPITFLTAAIGAALPSAAGAENAVWSHPVNVTVLENALEKTGSDGWNAGASSAQALVSGDGWVEFGAGDTAADKACGLGRNSVDQSLDEIDFAIKLGANGQATIVEKGVAKLAAGAYLTSDRFRVAVESTQVVYRKNGTLLYTSAAIPSYPLLADAALYHAGATLA